MRKAKPAYARHQDHGTRPKTDGAHGARYMSTEAMEELVSWFKTRPNIVEDPNLPPEPEPFI